MPILDCETSLHPADLLERAGADSGRSWWAVYTRPRQEKSLARQLVAHGLSFYLPLIPRDRPVRGRPVRSHIPLFPSYVFLFGTEPERLTALTTNRISHTVLVPDQDQLYCDLANLCTLIERGVPLSAERRLLAGRRVRIKCGSLSGLEGTVIRRRGQCRLLVAVHYLCQGASVEIDASALELL